MSVSKDKSGTLRAQEHGHQPAICYGISAYESNAMKSNNPNSGVYLAETARTLDNNGGSPACNQGGMAIVSLLNDQGGSSMSGEDDAKVSPTIRAEMHGNVPAVVYDARENGNGCTVPTLTGDHENRITDYTAVCIGNGQADQLGMSEKVGALNCMHDQHGVAYGIDRATFNMGQNAKFSIAVEKEVEPTMVAKGPGAVAHPVYSSSKASFFTEVSVEKANTLMATDYKDPPAVMEDPYYVVRRLTPLECERLQGFPDGWTDIGDWTDSKGKKHKAADSPRYRALGNSIAIPSWFWVLSRLNKYCKEHTMASLFDGIGGFPLIWETLNGRGSCLWASEIEEFPMAVTKIRFGGE